jgi:protein required for attachment to host cells
MDGICGRQCKPNAAQQDYHKSLSDSVGELDKDLTGHSIPAIEKALAAV